MTLEVDDIIKACSRLRTVTQDRQNLLQFIARTASTEDIVRWSEELMVQGKFKAPDKAPAKSNGQTPKKPAPKTVTEQTWENSVRGTEDVRSGKRPPLKKAMVAVMGTEVMSAGAILAALGARGWAPVSSDPHQYVSFMLSSNSTVFERTEKRGYYRVHPDILAQTSPASAPASSASAPAKKISVSCADIMQAFADNHWSAATASQIAQHFKVSGSHLSNSLMSLVRHKKLEFVKTNNRLVYHKVEVDPNAA